jgi:hypothetical protein
VLPVPVLVFVGGLKLLLARRPWPCWGSRTAPQLPDERFTAQHGNHSVFMQAQPHA